MRSISCNGTVKTVGVPSWEAAKVGYTYTTSETWPSHGRPNGTTCRRPWQVLLGAKRVGWRPTRRGRWPLAVLVDEFRFNSQGDFGRSNSNRLGCTNSLLSYTRSSFVCGTVRVTVVMSHPMAIGKSPQSVARGASRNPDSVMLSRVRGAAILHGSIGLPSSSFHLSLTSPLLVRHRVMSSKTDFRQVRSIPHLLPSPASLARIQEPHK